MDTGHLSHLVSAVTYLDLSITSYDDFRDQLISIHGQLQHVAGGSQGDSYWTFPDVQWWYSIISLPESEISPNHFWRLLADLEQYNSVVDDFLSDERTGNSYLLITNNLQYIHSEMTLLAAQYPRMQVCGNTVPGDAFPVSTPIFPVLFRLGPTPMTSMPPLDYRHLPKIDDPTFYRTLSYSQLLNFDYGFPQGMTLGYQPFIYRPPEVQSWPINHRSASDTSQGLTNVSSIPTPMSSVFSRESISYQGKRPSHLYPSADRVNRRPSSSLYTPSTPAFTEDLMCNADTGVSIPIRIRSASSLGRRYSIPFDAYTTDHGCPSRSEKQVVWVTATDKTQAERCRKALGTNLRETKDATRM